MSTGSPGIVSPIGGGAAASAQAGLNNNGQFVIPAQTSTATRASGFSCIVSEFQVYIFRVCLSLVISNIQLINLRVQNRFYFQRVHVLINYLME